jgi:putative ABC transport system permease protein
MQLLEGIRIALAAIWAHKLRSALVMLGNVIAVASIIAVVSIVDGMNVYMHEKVFDQGSGRLTVKRVDDMKVLTDLDAFLESIYNPRLTLADRDWLRERLVNAGQVGASRNARDELRVGREKLRGVPLRGYTGDYPFIQNMELADGRHFTASEVQRARPVAVIGHRVAKDLFPSLDPLGRKIKVGRRSYTVIGVAVEKGRLLGDDQDTFAAIPITRVLKHYGRRGRARSVNIDVTAMDLESIEALKDEIQAAMRERHRLRPGDRDDFEITSSDTLLGFWETAKKMLLSVLLMIVGISAVVAGIVIMNIMLVSVQERTREIGIRKAIGARENDVLWQFLVEALTLSTLGGLLGILLGFGAAAGIAGVSPLPYAVKIWSVMMGLVLAVSVGVSFGIYPARRAARLDPVEALRHE